MTSDPLNPPTYTIQHSLSLSHAHSRQTVCEKDGESGVLLSISLYHSLSLSLCHTHSVMLALASHLFLSLSLSPLVRVMQLKFTLRSPAQYMSVHVCVFMRMCVCLTTLECHSDITNAKLKVIIKVVLHYYGVLTTITLQGQTLLM